MAAIHDTREGKELIPATLDTREDKQLIQPESEEDEKARRKRRKKEKKRKKELKREKERLEREEQERKEKIKSDRALDLKMQRVRDEEKLNNINSPGLNIDKSEPKVKFKFEDVVTKANSTKESAEVMRRSSFKEPQREYQRSDTLESFQDSAIFDFPRAAKPNQYSWSPRVSRNRLGESESSDEENASPKSPSFWAQTKDAGSDSSESDTASRRKLRRRFSEKKKKKKTSRMSSDTD